MHIIFTCAGTHSASSARSCSTSTSIHVPSRGHAHPGGGGSCYSNACLLDLTYASCSCPLGVRQLSALRPRFSNHHNLPVPHLPSRRSGRLEYSPAGALQGGEVELLAVAERLLKLAPMECGNLLRAVLVRDLDKLAHDLHRARVGARNKGRVVPSALLAACAVLPSACLQTRCLLAAVHIRREEL